MPRLQPHARTIPGRSERGCPRILVGETVIAPVQQGAEYLRHRVQFALQTFAGRGTRGVGIGAGGGLRLKFGLERVRRTRQAFAGGQART